MKIEKPHLLFDEQYIASDTKTRVKVVVAFGIVILTILIISVLNIKGVN